MPLNNTFENQGYEKLAEIKKTIEYGERLMKDMPNLNFRSIKSRQIPDLKANLIKTGDVIVLILSINVLGCEIVDYQKDKSQIRALYAIKEIEKIPKDFDSTILGPMNKTEADHRCESELFANQANTPSA